jgi:hypothetical protein
MRARDFDQTAYIHGVESEPNRKENLFTADTDEVHRMRTVSLRLLDRDSSILYISIYVREHRGKDTASMAFILIKVTRKSIPSIWYPAYSTNRQCSWPSNKGYIILLSILRGCIL